MYRKSLGKKTRQCKIPSTRGGGRRKNRIIIIKLRTKVHTVVISLHAYTILITYNYPREGNKEKSNNNLFKQKVLGRKIDEKKIRRHW